MALLEGAPVGRATATGMAAVTAVFLCGLKTGDHVVSANALFGSCLLCGGKCAAALRHHLHLGRWQRPGRLGSGDEAGDQTAVPGDARPIPTLSIVDIAAVAKIADSHGARLVVDNAFASPALQRPMEFGAHIVVHSSTKYHRRPGPRPGRRDPVPPGFPGRASAALPAQHRTHASAPSMPGCISRAWRPWTCA